MAGSLLLTLIVVVGLSVGQVLFKYSAASLSGGFDIPALIRNPYFLAALILYAGCTLLWTYVLTTAELSKVYPVVSLSFVFVPLLSYFLFKETLGLSYAVGIGFILIGLVLIVR